MNFFSFFDYLNREVFTQDASYLPDTKKFTFQTSRSPENKLQGIQLMKVTFLGLPTENVLLSVVVMGAVILICFGISVKCFKWE